MDKIKLVVYNEYALGYILPQQPNLVCILSNSILRGAPLKVCNTPYPISFNDKVRLASERGAPLKVCNTPYPISFNDKVRLASEKDFEDYRVCFEGFDNPEMYEFDSNVNKE